MIATFAAGCFWGVEATFSKVSGVSKTTVGYTGGHLEHPTYYQVCGGLTGHVEAIQIVFDPELVSYEQLLELFWHIHNPTTLNRQGPDVGSQYRSAIFYHDDQQRMQAEHSKEQHQATLQNPIVTQVAPASMFWPAEEYHQKYHEKQGGNCNF